jgi:hypothetical protein
MVYATAVVTPGGATQSNAQANNQTLLRRFYIDSLELDDNMGRKKEGLELQRGEFLTSYTWYNSIGTDFPQQPVVGLASTNTAYQSGMGSYTHLIPFSSDFRTTVEKGINTGMAVCCSVCHNSLSSTMTLNKDSCSFFKIIQYIHLLMRASTIDKLHEC